jgi:hypothetical protein
LKRGLLGLDRTLRADVPVEDVLRASAVDDPPTGRRRLERRHLIVEAFVGLVVVVKVLSAGCVVAPGRQQASLTH